MTTSGGARPSSSPASQRRRRRIIDATFELLREHDAAKLSVADIAKVAGVSVASVYNLVGTRERVLAAVIDRYVERLAAALGEQLPEATEPTGSDTSGSDQGTSDPGAGSTEIDAPPVSREPFSCTHSLVVYQPRGADSRIS